MERKNIILDFMDPENRILYGSYKNLSPEEHTKLLAESLNLAVFICKDYCILPPCAVMQCKYARKALLESPDFFSNGLIKFPVRESSLASFFAKKRSNYLLYENDSDYMGFFEEDGPSFLLKNATQIIKRETKVGEAVAEMVAAMDIEDPLFSGLRRLCTIEEIKRIRSAPKEVLEKGEAISVKAINNHLGFENDEDRDFQIGRILQNKYFHIYIYEYDSYIIKDIPPKTTDFNIESFGVGYDYNYWRYILKSLGIFDLITNSVSKVIVDIRDISFFDDFIDSCFLIGNLAENISIAKHNFSMILTELKKNGTYVRRIDCDGEVDELSFETEEYLSELFFSFWDNVNKKQFKPIDINHFEKSNFAKTKTLSSNVEKLKLQLTPCDHSKPYVFIGYCRSEMEETVYKDCIALGKMGINYWIDNANMYGMNQNSEGWKSIINQALTNCSVYIPYISPMFFNSEPCCEEVKNFFDLNQKASIIILLKNGFVKDKIIRQILTYDNILQGQTAKNMIKLFKAEGSTAISSEKYSINQLYRFCSDTLFEHYLSDSIFYNTFLKSGILTIEEYSTYNQWREKGNMLIEGTI